MGTIEVLTLNAGFLILVLFVLFILFLTKRPNGNGNANKDTPRTEIKHELNKIREQIVGQHDIL